MRDPLILLTGSTTGIGREAAKRLASEGARLVLVARSEAKARGLVDLLNTEAGEARHDFLVGDLSRPAEVRRVAAEFKAKHDRLDVLFNNAGAVFVERQETPEGLERTFALNHLAYFLLTIELLDVLKASGPARVVSTTSDAHKSGDLAHLDDLQNVEWGWGGMKAYARSKLANVWFTIELARRLEGTDVTATCFHPGFVASNFARDNGGWAKLVMQLTRPFQRSLAKGADTGVWLCRSKDVAGQTGGYYFDRKLGRMGKAARDPQAPGRLWSESERILARLDAS